MAKRTTSSYHAVSTARHTRLVPFPKGSFLDKDGARKVKIIFDVMTDNGNRFNRQIIVIFPLTFSLSLGKWLIELSSFDEIHNIILQQYPSLAAIHCPVFHPTSKRLVL